MTKPITFEKSIAQLEAIVAQLENGELSLEDSLKQFEKGIILARKCEETLAHAEQKIEILSTTRAIKGDISDE
jgi:exodeoxyribonuclease VII small subunit